VMSPTSWWRSTETDKRPSLLPWRRKRQQKVEPPLRIAVRGLHPIEAQVIRCDVAIASPVGWLLQSAAMIPDSVTTANLEPVPDASVKPLENFPGGANVSPQLRVAANSGQDSKTQTGPALVERLRILLAAPLDALLPGPNTVLDWAGELMPFQQDGVRALIKSERLLLADDMGLGKTLQVVAALRILFVQRLIESALVVAPASLLDQWRQELTKWAPELRAIVIRGSQMDRSWQWAAEVHVTIVSYETLRSDFTDDPRSPLRRRVWDVVVADEAQRIKNRNDTSATLKGLERKRSWALTGTPLENNEDELASILEFVDHGHLVPQKRYSPGPELWLRHKELQLRRKKSEVLQDLPPKLTTKLGLALLPKQAQSYQRAEQEGIVHLKELGAEVQVQNVLELITRLKQICNADPVTGESSKIEDIRQRMEILTQQQNRAIIFSQYTSETFGVDAVAQALREFNPLSFKGDLSQDERRSVIQRFRSNDDHKVLILSLRSGGVGLNLQEASYVFHLDRWWNPAVER